MPKYIEKFHRQKEEEQERLRQQEEESKVPPGTRLMPESELLKTLEELCDTRKEVNNMLERLPLANQSLATQRRKRDLEEKLLKIEKAIETFSKKTVYIAL